MTASDDMLGRGAGQYCKLNGRFGTSPNIRKVTNIFLLLALIMAEYPDEGSPGVGEEETEERGGENSDEYEPETMTAAEVLEKLEEVSCPLP